MISLINKYRPQKLDEVIGQQKAVQIFKRNIERDEDENFLLFGPPGTGKTTIAMAYAKESGYEFREFNASDDRRIEFIRGTIIPIARAKSLTGTKKVIFLDEADQLTKDSQMALRRVMESPIYKNNIFILAANEPEKLKDALISRCVPIRFKPLTNDDLSKIMEIVIKGEKVDIKDEDKLKLIENARGDARRMITLITEYATDGKIEDIVFDMKKFLSIIKTRNFDEALYFIKDYSFKDVSREVMFYLKERKNYKMLVRFGDRVIFNYQPDDIIGKMTIIGDIMEDYYNFIKTDQKEDFI
jgi:DNA polymerase III delta prime subunit